MASYMITDKYAFGGVKVSSKESIDIRINQINDKFRLHTCYYYGDSLKIISKASKEINLIPKLIVKLYFNYNFFWIDSLPDNRRFNSCYDQLKIIIDELNFIPDDLHLEICCNPPLKNIKNNEFQKFKEKVQKEFNVNETTFMLKVIDEIKKKLPDDVINLITHELLKIELNLDEKYEEKIEHYVETLRYDYFQIMMKLEPNTSFPTNLIIEDLFKDLPYIETDLSLFIRTEWSELLAEEHEKDENKFNTLASIINHFKQSAHKIKYTHNGKTYRVAFIACTYHCG